MNKMFNESRWMEHPNGGEDRASEENLEKNKWKTANYMKQVTQIMLNEMWFMVRYANKSPEVCMSS